MREEEIGGKISLGGIFQERVEQLQGPGKKGKFNKGFDPFIWIHFVVLESQ